MKRNSFLIAALIIATTLIATLVLYPDLPRSVPTHWNFRGGIDRYGDKQGVFLGPALMVGIVLFFAVLPWLSPKRYEVDTFRSTYLYIMLVALACGRRGRWPAKRCGMPHTALPPRCSYGPDCLACCP